MGVYLEPVRRDPGAAKRSRLRADTVTELHAFVDDAGLAGAPFTPNATMADLGYYELDAKGRRNAVRAGAESLDWSEAHHRIATQMVDGSRPRSRKQGRYGVTRTVPVPQPQIIDLRAPIDEPAAVTTPQPTPAGTARSVWRRRLVSH